MFCFGFAYCLQPKQPTRAYVIIVTKQNLFFIASSYVYWLILLLNVHHVNSVMNLVVIQKSPSRWGFCYLYLSGYVYLLELPPANMDKMRNKLTNKLKIAIYSVMVVTIVLVSPLLIIALVINSM